MGRIAWCARSVVAAEQRGLEGPEVGEGAQDRLGGNRGTPGRGERAPAGSIAVVRGDISRPSHAVIPALDETRVHARSAGARVARRLDVDGETTTLRDAEGGGSRGGGGGIALARVVPDDVRAVVVVVDRQDPHVEVGGRGDLRGADSWA